VVVGESPFLTDLLEYTKLRTGYYTSDIPLFSEFFLDDTAEAGRLSLITLLSVTDTN
jgi:hypothetical protein